VVKLGALGDPGVDSLATFAGDPAPVSLIALTR